MDHHVSTFHDPDLIAVSIVIALFASFTSLQLTDRMRAHQGAARMAWLCAAAIALGGGVWSMHAIAMLAFHISVGVTYDAELVFAALFLPIIATGVSYRIIVDNPAATWRLIAGGLIIGLGIAGLHYIGMAAMIMTARATYAPALITLSACIAVAASTAALWLNFSLQTHWRRWAASLIMAAAIVGMHYTGMAAMDLQAPDSPALVFTSGIDQPLLALVITAITALILMLGFGASLLDRRIADQAVRERHIRQSSEQRYHSLVRNSADIIVVLDQENRISYGTPAAERILGYSPDSWIGKSFLGFVEPLHQGELRDLLLQLRNGGKIDYELPMAAADGTLKWPN